MKRHTLTLIRRRDGSPRVVLPLRTWLTMSHLTVFVLPIVVFFGSGALGLDLRNQTVWDLEHQGVILSMLVTNQLKSAQQSQPGVTLEGIGPALSANLRAVKESTLAGIRITDERGIVIATSGTVLGEDLRKDAEVQRALAGEMAVTTKPRGNPSPNPITSKSRRATVRMFVAVPITLNREVLGTIVLSRTPREEVQALIRDMSSTKAMVASCLALLATLWIGLYAGYLLTRSLGIVASGTGRIAEGNFDAAGALVLTEQSHIADVARLAGSVSTMSDRLQTRLSYISEFASNVSHEFKTPLATLRGTLELLDDDPDMPAEQQAKFLENANTEVARLERMVDGLLLLARAEEGGEKAVHPLQDIIAKVSARYDITATGTAGDIAGDASQLESALANLVENAQKYGGDEISVAGWAEEGWTGWDVIDDGPGISAGNLPRVFDRFFTTGRAEGGSGLGLALVRAIAHGHGGRVTVASEPGRTCFRLSLPASGG